MKTCIACQKSYDEKERKRSKLCLDCKKQKEIERSKKWKATHQKEIKEWRREYDEKNILRRKAWRKKYDKENKEKIAKKAHEHYIRNKEKEKMARKINSQKPEVKARNAEWRRERRKISVNFKIRELLTGRLNTALRRQKLNKNSKSSRTVSLLGCDINYLMRHLESQFSEGMNWQNHGLKGWHIDHIKPCCSFDLSNPDEQKICFHYSNLQPLWATENLSKNGKILSCF